MKTSQDQKGVNKQSNNPKAVVIFPVAVIAIIAFAVYFNTLYNGFVYDDNGQVIQNPWIRDIKHLPEIFYKSVWSFQAATSISNYYRPLMHVIYMLNYYLFGLKPWGFHLVNILFHAGNSILVFFIASRLPLNAVNSEKLEVRRTDPPVTGKSRVVAYSRFTIHDSQLFALIPALLFAVHPIHTEAVAWVGAVTELSYTFFYLLSLYFYMRSGHSEINTGGASTSDKRNTRYALSVFFFFLAALCKEPAATLPVVLVAYDLAFGRTGERTAVRLKRYIPYFVILGIYFVVRSSALGGLAPVKTHGDLSTWQYIINVFPLFAAYLGKLLLPLNLNAFYVLHPISSVLELRGSIGIIVTATFAAAAVFTYRKNKTAFFGLLLIAVPLLPALYIPALGESAFAERYLYLPSLGFVILFTMAFWWLRGKMSRQVIVPLLLIAALAGLYSLQTVRRNPVWKDDITLFTDTVKRSPDGELPNGMLGIALMGAGRFDEAVEQFRKTLELNPDSANAHYNLGFTLMKKGLPEEAIPEFEKALTLTPNDPDAHRYLAAAYMKTGMIDRAMEKYRSLISLRPDSPETYLELGVALRQQGLTNQAIENYQKALAINPAYAEAHFNLGNTFADSGQLDKAIEHYKSAVKLQPGNAFFHSMLGITYGQKGSYDEAIEEFKAASQLAPSEPSYRRNLERAEGLKGSAGKPK